MERAPESDPNAQGSGWLVPTGEMGPLIAAFPWEGTELGAIAHWPAPLRSAANFVLHGAAAMALIVGPDFRFLYNDGYREIIQDKHPLALGNTAQQIFPEIWDTIRPLLEQAYAGQGVRLDDIALPLKRGGAATEAYFSGSYNPVLDEQGRVLGFVAVVVETTKRIQQERERAQIFDTTLSSIVDFAYIFDRNGRFRYVNKPLLDLWGLSLEQAVGKNFYELNYPPELAARLQAQIQEVVDHRRVVRDQTAYTGVNGQESYYEYIFSPVLDAQGSVMVVAGSTREISAIKQVENQLRTAQAALEEQASRLDEIVKSRTASLEEIVSELESFSYSVSHDLRGPLRSLQSFAEALAEDCQEQLPPVGQDYIQRIIAASSRMDRVIQDVLVYSRLARSELVFEAIELEPFIDGLCDSYPTLSPAVADIVLVRPLGAVKAGQALLTQCLANLLCNAVKFVKPGVRPRVEVSARREGGRVFVAVQDNGIGIPASAHETIFNLFYRLEPAYEGTGIGLAIVRRAMNRMGGRITLESVPGEGSRFTIDLADGA